MEAIYGMVLNVHLILPCHFKNLHLKRCSAAYFNQYYAYTRLKAELTK